jgi:hypothetical protein
MPSEILADASAFFLEFSFIIYFIGMMGAEHDYGLVNFGLVWSTIPLATDLGKISQSQEVYQWISMVIRSQAHRREPAVQSEIRR